ncbi:MAG: cupin domain-containing protein [Actinomycetota bacterium]|jgi:mannose-6-phosphate isomerase-like protein (cupin superfamily)|nr:cupin domain-containing protein [Actinomycetota bacterium]
MEKVNLADKFALFSEQWKPKIVGELNGQHVKLAKLQGDFVWHHHDNEDELFLVIEGQLDIEMKDGTISLSEGEFFIVPRGVEHRPVTRAEAHVLMLEPTTTLNTGNIQGERTVEEPDWL